VEDGRNALARMVLVDVTWSEWRPDTDRARYEEIVGKLVAPPRSPGPPGAEPAGPVYVHQCYEEGRFDTSWVVPSAPYELPPRDECRCPALWLQGEDGRDWALAALAAQEAAANYDRMALIRRGPDWRRLFRTRVAMSADRFRATAGCKGDEDYWVLIDMRFQWALGGNILWHTSFSVWSDLPWSDHHCPATAGHRDRHTLTPADAHRLISDYYTHTRQAFRLLIGAPDRSTLRVFGRYYQPPGFLVAVRDPHKGEADGPAADGSPDILRSVSNAILWTRRYKVLPRARLKGGVDVFRRFLPDGDHDRPRYLLIPDTRASAQAGALADQAYLRAIQEEATATGVRVLTDLEAFAASQLQGIDSRMRTRENHLRIYQAVADQAGTLWDALARLLPDSRGQGLEIVQRAIELVHQTLLQGVADLDQLVRNIDGALSHIEITADEITDRFDRELYHPAARSRRMTLRESLRGGYIDRLRRHVREASGTATRVTDSYRMLLNTIGLAFDERRVREGDRMQKAGVWLAIGFGILGLSGVAQATAPLGTVHRPWLVWLVRGSVWLLTLIAVGVAGWQFWQLHSAGRVASQVFERRYQFVREFLSDVSTDRLDDFRRTHRPGDRRPRADWQQLDLQLSRKFLKAWRSSDDAETETRPSAYDAAALRTRVESWTLRTLLLTERPRDFGPYAVPILTCLYRLCSAQELRDWRTAEETPSADSAVGPEELERVLSIGQYAWLLKEETGLLALQPPEMFAKLARAFTEPDGMPGEDHSWGIAGILTVTHGQLPQRAGTFG
jgi:hypothetical protein